MKISTTFLQSILATSLLASLPGTAKAELEFDARYGAELNACVAAIRDSVDLDGVQRIRHVVTRSGPTIIGQAFTLMSSTYAGDTERRYSAYCVANGDHPPLKLRIEEQAG
jgi:hypothetical protein